MRKKDFREYLQRTGYLINGVRKDYTSNAINYRLAKCAKVERELSCELDTEFSRDQMESILNQLAGNVKASVKHYKNFCSQSKPETQNAEYNISEIEEDLSGEVADDLYDIAFELEEQLRDFIASNIEKIPCNGMRLKLYKEGTEVQTEAGRIDILAENENGDLVVFELKRGRSPDHVIGQLTRYMGWIKENIAHDKTVHGIIVAKSISKNLHYAKTAIPNVSLLEYEVNFKLNTAVREEY